MNTNLSTGVPRKRGCLFYIGRGLLGFIIGLVALVVLGFAYQSAAVESDKQNFSPRGQLYTINGHQMHLVCTGEGSPTVILQAGLSAKSLWWYRVQNQLAAHTQVCSYDRPGMGWSEPASGTHDALTISSELHNLLDQAGIAAPYIAVGHSYGAVLTRIFAQQYPEEVLGVVLVDTELITPKHFANQSEFDSYLSFFEVSRTAFSVMTQVGIMRLTQPGHFQAWGYTTEIVPELVGLQARNRVIDAFYEENGLEFRTLQEASAAAEKLDAVPMMVLWASETYDANHMNPNLRDLADEVVGYSSNSANRIIEGANHGSILGNEQYAQQVSAAVLDVIQAAQTGEPLTQE